MATDSTRDHGDPQPDGEESATGSDSVDTRAALVRKRVGLVLGLVLAGAVYALLPGSLSPDGKVAAAVAALMAVWWMTEALPLPATALVPLVAFPVLLSPPEGEEAPDRISEVAAPYANDIIFLFMGGFLLAMAMQRWNLHRRIALTIVAAVGSGPLSLIAGFMLATAFITMWVSNTATTVESL